MIFYLLLIIFILNPSLAHADGGSDWMMQYTNWVDGIQWNVIFITIAISILLYGLLKWTLKHLKEVDLLDHFHLRALVKSKWYPAIFQVPALIVFGVIAYFLFFGSPNYSNNPGSILIWTFWWAILPFSFVLIGRLWCAICPFALISDLVQKYFGKRKQVPRWLAKYSFWIVDISFIFITWFDRVYGMTEYPLLTGLIFLGLFTGVILCGFLYERRIFCRYVCFLGNVAGNYSMVSPLELKPKNPETCKSCKEKACYFGTDKQAGCPFYQIIPTKNGNRFCVLCGNCVKACPHDNVALQLRPFGSDFWQRAYVRFEESFFAKILVGVVIIQNIGMLSLWNNISDFVQKFTGITNEKVLFTIIYILTMAIPVGLMFLSSAISAKFAKEKLLQNFARFGYAFIAVDLAGHLAHNLNHLFGEGKNIIAAIAGIFSGTVKIAMSQWVLNYGTVKILQYLILIIGVMGTFIITYMIAKRKAKTTGEIVKIITPHLVLLAGLMTLNFYIFSMPMEHRGEVEQGTHNHQETENATNSDHASHHNMSPPKDVNGVPSMGTSATISFDNSSYDFGEIKQFSGTVQKVFTVKNEGKDTLKIGEITTSCSCTAAKIDKIEIAPDNTANLTVIFNPNLHEEPKEKFKRIIFIPTNDPKNPEAQLTIWVDILEGQ